MGRGRFRVDGAGVCLQPPQGDLVTVCGRCARRDGGDEDAARDTRELAWREFAGTLGQWRTGAVRLGVESLAAGRGRG